MTAIGKLLGFGGKPPQAPPPSPRIGDAAAESAVRRRRARASGQFGVEESFLSGGTLGTTGSGNEAQIIRPTSTLGS